LIYANALGYITFPSPNMKWSFQMGPKKMSKPTDAEIDDEVHALLRDALDVVKRRDRGEIDEDHFDGAFKDIAKRRDRLYSRLDPADQRRLKRRAAASRKRWGIKYPR
jgi:hypothetical protein